jgi:hypothetical protein
MICHVALNPIEVGYGDVMYPTASDPTILFMRASVLSCVT